MSRKWVWFWREQLACFLGCDRCCCYFRNHSGSDLQAGCWRSIQHNQTRLNASPTKTSTTEWNRKCPQRTEELKKSCTYVRHFTSLFIRKFQSQNMYSISSSFSKNLKCYSWLQFYKFDLFSPQQLQEVLKDTIWYTSYVLNTPASHLR